MPDGLLVAHTYPEGQRDAHRLADDGACPCGPEVQPTISTSLHGALVVHRDVRPSP